MIWTIMHETGENTIVTQVIGSADDLSKAISEIKLEGNKVVSIEDSEGNVYSSTEPRLQLK